MCNFAVENRENGRRLGNSNEFDCTRLAPSLQRQKITKMKKEMMNLLCTLLLLIGGCLTTQAQDVSKFKALNDSAYQTTAEYQTGNKYQKDAILFMDMVADTHP